MGVRDVLPSQLLSSDPSIRPCASLLVSKHKRRIEISDLDRICKVKVTDHKQQDDFQQQRVEGLMNS